MDVGIDLGTATVIVYIGGEGVVLSEPSVIAVNLKTDSVISVGQEAYEMIGKTPSHIQANSPAFQGRGLQLQNDRRDGQTLYQKNL